MASYYYLISSLPMLKTDGSVPMDFNSFLEQCKPNVSTATFKALSELSSSGSKHPMLKEWSGFYNSLMEELNYQRKLKLGKQTIAPSNRESEIVTAIASALSAENPLVSEQMLLELEFKRVDSLIGLHNFDEYFLFGYAIKLKLLERKAVFKHDEGKAEFTSLLNGVKNQIQSM